MIVSLKKKRLLLINPNNPYKKGLAIRRESLQPPLGLGIIAALTPSDWSIRILDENFKSFKFREADLVGITALTATAARAYEIAAEFRAKGIPTVIGGVHATLMPDEAANYTDTVVTGEAENIWGTILSDFTSGNLKKRYNGTLPDLSTSPIPRHDLFHPGYIFAAVQATRGCPLNCDFCSVPTLSGHMHRLRDVKDILDELESIPHRLIYFVDDNLIGTSREAREHAIALFRGMIERKLNKEWFAYASLNVADYEEVIELAAKSGCRIFLIGIEAEKPEQLEEANKKMNLKIGPENYGGVVRILHKHGICALGTFIYGLDHDTPEDLKARTRYMLRSPFDMTQGTILTPFPGTRLFDRLQAEGRILCTKFPEDWKYFQGMDIVYQPKQMSPDVLAENMNQAVHSLYSRRQIVYSMLRTLWNTRKLTPALWSYNTNLNYRKISFESEINGAIMVHDNRPQEKNSSYPIREL
jgi:radical SAM superfamily enzyme YgiQ (UPF0313 family)